MATDDVHLKIVEIPQSSPTYATVSLPQNLTNTPAVVITFDDGMLSVYTYAHRYMKRHNMKGVAYINTDVIGTAGYMSAGMLQEMNTAGWNISNHAMTQVDLTSLTQAEVETTLSGAKAALDALGLTGASAHVAYPSGLYNATVLAAMAATGMITGRKYNASSLLTLPELAGAWYEMPSYYIQHTTTLTTAKSHIDDVIAANKISILNFHGLTPETLSLNYWSVSDFEALMDYIIQQRLAVLNITQVYGLVSAPLSWSAMWEA